MYTAFHKHTLKFLTPLLMFVSVHAQQTDVTLTEFDPESYAISLRTILEKLKEPGAYQGRIALEFADHYNKIVKRFPSAIQQIDEITRSIAVEYQLRYEQEGTMITTAQFVKSNQPELQSPSAGNANAMQSQIPEEIFIVVEQMPRFPGCEDIEGNNEQKYQCAQSKLLEYVYANLQYPSEARIAGIQGRVVVQFVVEEDGEITDVTAVRDIGYGCGAELARIVQAMNNMDEKWTPGKQRGIPVRVLFTFPFTFKL